MDKGENGKREEMGMAAEETQILNVIDTYVRAVNTADADLIESLHWKSDPRFSQVENDRPMPFGEQEFTEIRDWVRRHGKPGEHQRFYDTKVYILAPEVAYTVSLRDESNIQKTSRVTLVLLKKDGEWRIIHGHFSLVPD